MPEEDEIDIAAAADEAAKLEAPDRVPEDDDDAHPEDIPAELIELSVALDTGDAESTAAAAAELATMGGQA
ncbi:MAG TPA: hypothetical protein VMW08_00205 [Acidimicrobiales bacterium]|nr:hypothetical protein [Acidimicrobiales bacterium]